MDPGSTCRRIVLCIGSLLAVGCGGDTVPATAPDAEELATKHVASSELPALGDYLPPLDEGRLRIAAPQDWGVLPRDQDFVVQFVLDKTRRSLLPRLRVTAEDSPWSELADASEENLLELTALVDAGVNPDHLVERPRPMIIGETPCVRYVVRTVFNVRSGDSRRIDAERQIIKTVAGGRLYTFDLQIYKGTILHHRDTAYAVVAGLEFIRPETCAPDPVTRRDE